MTSNMQIVPSKLFMGLFHFKRAINQTGLGQAAWLRGSNKAAPIGLRGVSRYPLDNAIDTRDQHSLVPQVLSMARQNSYEHVDAN